MQPEVLGFRGELEGGPGSPQALAALLAGALGPGVWDEKGFLAAAGARPSLSASRPRPGPQ